LASGSLHSANSGQIGSRHAQLRSFKHRCGSATQWRSDAQIVCSRHTLVAGSHASQATTLAHSVAGTHGPQQPSITDGTWPGEQLPGSPGQVTGAVHS
jgi:hypothetical protein